uniref:Uncharacterized protein n=1 Tax=Ralstonia solanacearum TaxID=305 RepID=A0A0S4UBI3_RALSL|nr:protein of unknown function [Ralstonia solanacearum]
MGYINPVLELPAAQKLAALPLEQRLAIAAVFRELRGAADDLAESSWRRRKCRDGELLAGRRHLFTSPGPRTRAA